MQASLWALESFSSRFLCWALLVVIHSKMRWICKSVASFNFSSEVWCGKLWFFILVVPSLYMIQVPPTLRFVLDGEMPKHLLAKDLILQVMLKPLSYFLLEGIIYQSSP
jgi:hypothetical protein